MMCNPRGLSRWAMIVLGVVTINNSLAVGQDTQRTKFQQEAFRKENKPNIMNQLSQNLQISGGMDARAVWKEGNNVDPRLQGVFLNLRKIFRDALGDRWILSLQGDADDNFDKIRSYQTFLQHKGPLGKWNIRVGHYILPFGLLQEYDTERLLLRTIEDETIRIKLDTGIEIFGYWEDWDSALSVSEGIGRRWGTNYDENYLISGRISRSWGDWKAGFSALVGNVRTSEEFPLGDANLEEQKVALDVVRETGPWILRGELVGGLEEERGMGNGLLLADYAITNRLELNTKYALIGRSEVEQQLGIGVSFRWGKGWILRVSDTLEIESGETLNKFEIQLYYDFSKSF